MAIIEGLKRYICDRCSDNELVEPNADLSETWYTHTRSDAQGDYPKEFLLCGICESSYQTFKTAEDEREAEYLANREALYEQWWDDWADDPGRPEESEEESTEEGE